MKRGVKITLIVLGIILALGIAVFVSADVLLSRIATRQVNKALASLPEGEASCGAIELRLFSGTASVEDLRFEFRGAPISKRDTTRPGASIYVERIDIGRIFYSMLLNKQVLVHELKIVRPRVELWMDEEHPEKCFPAFEPDTTPVSFPLQSTELMRLRLKNASFALHSVRTKLDVVADSLSLTAHDLCYDTAFHFCDSVYAFALRHAAVLTPDGRTRIETRDLSHSDQGPLTLGETRIANTMPKKKLGDLVREPATWIDMRLEQVTTSPLNPIRKALAQDLTLDQVDAVVAQMHVFRDMRYKPKHPFPMPQEALMALPVVFDIRQVNAQLNAIHVDFASTDKNIGQLDLSGIQATVNNVTNRRNQTMRVSGSCPVDQGMANVQLALTMDKDCHFEADIHTTAVNTTFLSPFVRPLVGITADCQVDTLDTHYTGDRVKADGTFRMLYHGLNIKVHKEDDIPYKIITRNANTFTNLGNAFTTHSNPGPLDRHPRAYKVTWKRDEWHDFGLFLFGPCIDGVKKTFLPGLYVHLQTKQ